MEFSPTENLQYFALNRSVARVNPATELQPFAMPLEARALCLLELVHRRYYCLMRLTCCCILLLHHQPTIEKWLGTDAAAAADGVCSCCRFVFQSLDAGGCDASWWRRVIILHRVMVLLHQWASTLCVIYTRHLMWPQFVRVFWAAHVK